MRRSALLPAVLLAAVGFACSGSDAPPAAREGGAAETERVIVAGQTFEVEVAADPETRQRGLGGRASIPENGGMLFVLPRPRPFSMVMRDCPIPIDVAFIDSMGRVVAMHEMVPEPPRRPDESRLAYEMRLPPYPSGEPVQFALETAGGRLRELGLQVGQRLHFPAQELIERARSRERAVD